MDQLQSKLGLSRRTFMAGLAAIPIASIGEGAAATARFDPAPTVRELARLTRAEYHDPRLGSQIADQLLTALHDGRFASLDPEAVAGTLNRIVAATARDAHFVIMAGEMAHVPPVPPTAPHSQPPPLSASELEHLRRENFGFGTLAILDGNVGLIQVRAQFYRPAEQVRQRLAAAMTYVSDTWGLIIDVTRSYGGDPKGVALFLSYFFDRRPFVLNRFRWRNLPTEEFRTTANPGGPRYGEERPIAVLVSSSTVSAPEEFAYDVQTFHRGLVVGQRTAGAANHALPVSLPGGLTAFIPKARAENPVSRTNWEGVGVQPDVEADPSSPSAAHRAVLERIAGSAHQDRANQARLALQRLTRPTT